MAEEQSSLKHRNRLLYAVIALSALLAMSSVALSIVWIDRHRSIEEARRARFDQARDAWARYDSGIEACERGNALRLTVNELVVANQGLNKLLIEFFDSSVRLRKQLHQPELAKTAVAAREEIRRSATKTHRAKLTDCAEVIPVPSVPRPSRALYSTST